MGAINFLRLSPRSNVLKSVARMVLMFSGSLVKIIDSMLTVALSKVLPTNEYRPHHISSQVCVFIALSCSLMFCRRDSRGGFWQPREAAKARSWLHLCSHRSRAKRRIAPKGTSDNLDSNSILVATSEIETTEMKDTSVYCKKSHFTAARWTQWAIGTAHILKAMYVQ